MGKPLGPTGEFFRRRDEWRRHPVLTNQFRHATPGLGIALVAFGIYLVGEQVYDKLIAPSSSHHPHHQASASPSPSTHLWAPRWIFGGGVMVSSFNFFCCGSFNKLFINIETLSDVLLCKTMGISRNEQGVD